MKIETLKDHQAVTESFTRLTGIDNTSEEAYALLQSEVGELGVELARRKPDRLAIAGELADIMNFTAQLANEYGIDMSEAVTGKYERNYHKYFNGDYHRLRELRVSPKDIFKKLKGVWDKGRDHLYMKGV